MALPITEIIPFQGIVKKSKSIPTYPTPEEKQNRRNKEENEVQAKQETQQQKKLYSPVKGKNNIYKMRQAKKQYGNDYANIPEITSIPK